MRDMRCSLRGLGVSLFLPIALLGAFRCFAETIRTKGDKRLWQTVPDRSAPLSWPWMEEADSAVLVFSNRLTRTVSSVFVERVADESFGSCSQPVPQSGDSFVDVTLVQTGGGNEVVRESASLAYVSGAGGGPITVRTLGTRAWNRIPEPRVFAFDPVWYGETGDSGYDIVCPLYTGFKLLLR